MSTQMSKNGYGTGAMKHSNISDEHRHEEAPRLELPRPLSWTKTIAMLGATVSIAIYAAQMMTGTVGFGVPGSMYRTPA